MVQMTKGEYIEMQIKLEEENLQNIERFIEGKIQEIKEFGVKSYTLNEIERCAQNLVEFVKTAKESKAKISGMKMIREISNSDMPDEKEKTLEEKAKEWLGIEESLILILRNRYGENAEFSLASDNGKIVAINVKAEGEYLRCRWKRYRGGYKWVSEYKM